MSRTYNHRPRWVKLNDPKFPTKECHQHFEVKRERVGEEEALLYPWREDRTETYMRPVYRRWVETVPCTIDIPAVSWIAEQYRTKQGVEKLCDKRPLIYSCPCCTRKSLKENINRAQRTRINQQMRRAVTSYGRNCDTDPESYYLNPDGFDEYGTIWRVTDVSNWWDVDISEAHKVHHDYDWD